MTTQLEWFDFFLTPTRSKNGKIQEKDLREHLSRLRIDALVRVVELTKQDISAYAHEVRNFLEADGIIWNSSER